jgi:hypothetical protein
MTLSVILRPVDAKEKEAQQEGRKAKCNTIINTSLAKPLWLSNGTRDTGNSPLGQKPMRQENCRRPAGGRLPGVIDGNPLARKPV